MSQIVKKRSATQTKPIVKKTKPLFPKDHKAIVYFEKRNEEETKKYTTLIKSEFSAQFHFIFHPEFFDTSNFLKIYSLAFSNPKIVYFICKHLKEEYHKLQFHTKYQSFYCFHTVQLCQLALSNNFRNHSLRSYMHSKYRLFNYCSVCLGDPNERCSDNILSQSKIQISNCTLCFEKFCTGHRFSYRLNIPQNHPEYDKVSKFQMSLCFNCYSKLKPFLIYGNEIWRSFRAILIQNQFPKIMLCSNFQFQIFGPPQIDSPQVIFINYTWPNMPPQPNFIPPQIPVSVPRISSRRKN